MKGDEGGKELLSPVGIGPEIDALGGEFTEPIRRNPERGDQGIDIVLRHLMFVQRVEDDFRRAFGIMQTPEHE